MEKKKLDGGTVPSPSTERKEKMLYEFKITSIQDTKTYHGRVDGWDSGKMTLHSDGSATLRLYKYEDSMEVDYEVGWYCVKKNHTYNGNAILVVNTLD